MFTDAQLDALLFIFRQRMQSVTDEYIQRIAKHIAQISELAPSDINRIEQMKRVRLNMSAVKQKLAQVCSRSESEIEEMFKLAAKSNMRFAAQLFGLESVPKMSPRILQILSAQMKVTAGEFKNLSRTTLESANYIKCVDTAISAVQAGVADYGSAIRSSLGNAGMNGVRVTYPSGYRMRADSAMRMNILDGVRSLNNAMLKELGEEFGADGVEISAHMMCAEDHLPYQGRQYSQKDFEENVQGNLTRQIGMWNCRHAIYPIKLGVSRRAYSDEKLEEYRQNSTEEIFVDGQKMSRYRWTQEMRKTETAIRYKKDAGNALRLGGDYDGQRRVQREIDDLKEHYTKIAGAIDVKPAWNRTYVDGYKVPKD